MSTNEEPTGRPQEDEVAPRGQGTAGPDGEPAATGTETMTAAEESGQVAFGAEQPTGETGATGAGSSSG